MIMVLMMKLMIMLVVVMMMIMITEMGTWKVSLSADGADLGPHVHS